MSLFRNRRLIAVATATLFVISVAGHGFLMGDMSAKMAAAAASMDMSSADASSDCGGDGNGMQMACFALCASNGGVLSDPAELPIVISFRRADFTVLDFMPGQNGPPDPYPPRSITIG